MAPWLQPVAGGCLLRIKVVPGARRAGLAGVLGDRLKLRVSAPPEGGKANRAVEDLLSTLTGYPCSVSAGHGTPLKTVMAAGGDPVRLTSLLGGDVLLP